jgi:transposase
MIAIGVDAHKRIHVALALDARGQELSRWQAINSPEGWQDLLEWAVGIGEPRQWGIEGAWSYGRGLAQYLVECGEVVYEINPRWTALRRRGARRPGKTDRLDARAVALFVRQEAPDLPRVTQDDKSAILDLLATEREAAVAEAIRLRNQLHGLLMQLDPQYRQWLPRLASRSSLDVVEQHQFPGTSPLQEERAGVVRRMVQRLRLAMNQVEEVSEKIKRLAQEGFSPLTQIFGINLLTAGTLAGILGPGCRFSSDAELAAYAGVAPLETSSAGVVRHRLSRSGNRRLNGIVHLITWTQIRGWQPARCYLERRMSEGKSRREATRALKRFIIRAIWRCWMACVGQRTVAAVAEAA